MKKIYKSPDISVVMFEYEDIITASSLSSLDEVGENIFDFGKFDAETGTNLFGTMK